MIDYDVIIVGAGPGGCITAKTIETLTKNKINFVIIDSKPKENIGKKVCGDAVGKEIFDFLNKKINLEYPEDEVKQKIKGINVISPDKKSCYCIKTPEGGYMIDRLKFGQHLLNQIKNLNLITGNVIGVFDGGVLINDKNEIRKIYGKIIVDASGVNSIIRRNINSRYIEKNLNINEIMMCYREIRKLNKNSDYCDIYLDNELTNGGYVWEFPENDKINIGLGVRHPFKPKERYEIYLKNKKINSEILNDDSGFGIVPTRKPINSLVDVISENKKIGIMLVGDAACQVNPLHGGGIAPAMMGGYLAGKTISEIYNEEINLNDLWNYNVEYMRSEGAKNASLDLLKIFLQSMKNEEINFGMSKKIIDENDIININNSNRNLSLGVIDKIIIGIKGIKNISMLKKLKFIGEKMKEIRKLYEEYPENPEKFFEWKNKNEKIYKDVYEKLNI